MNDLTTAEGLAAAILELKSGLALFELASQWPCNTGILAHQFFLRDSALIAAAERESALRKALKALVMLKGYKEQYGKNDAYVAQQAMAWEAARKALSHGSANVPPAHPE